MSLTGIGFILAAYLWGGIPTSYLVARYKLGIDIRNYGSGNVGASNALSQIGKVTGILIGTFDCVGKGILPVLLARLLDQSLAIQVAIGLAAIAGHNWSPYLKLTGGRGVATAIGLLVAFGLWPEYLILGVVVGIVGKLLFRDSGFWTFVSLLALPVMAYLFHRPAEIIAMTLAIGALLLAKRLMANGEPPDPGIGRFHVYLYRILWDRDTATKDEWTNRMPDSTFKN
jgi:glycerol-3-phosphate acyltransferase PlsY